MGLFPLDTLKTRLQSQAGFWKSGGFSGIYRGIGPAFVGSAPNGITDMYLMTNILVNVGYIILSFLVIQPPCFSVRMILVKSFWRGEWGKISLGFTCCPRL